MTREQRFFLDILADHINGRTTVFLENIDWHQIIQYARSHQVEGIVWYQCRSFLEEHPEYDGILKRLHRAAIATTYFYANNLRAYADLKKLFRILKIRFFAVKGLDVAKMYPVPAYRTMGDLDIIMSTEDRESIQEPMSSIGFKLVSDGYEKHYSRNGVRLEIHDQLIYGENIETKRRREYFNTYPDYLIEDKDGNCLLDWSFHFLYLIEHAKQHFSAHGIGFRQFMDLIIMADKCDQIDWEWVSKQLKRIGLWEFTLNAFSCCEKWFEKKTHFPPGDLSEKEFAKTTELVFTNGVFGFGNEYHASYVVGKQLSMSKAPKPLQKTEMLIKRVCISYKKAVGLPYCSFVIGRRYLLPVAWIYRMLYIFHHRRAGRYAAEWRAILENDNVIAEHQELMKKWGIGHE